MKQMRLISALVLVTVASACAEPDRFKVPNAPSEADVLTKSLNRDASLDLQAGQFATNIVEDRGIPQLTELEAQKLATAFGRNYAIHGRRGYERDHGGPIAFERLTPCDRTFYAASPYENVDGSAPIHLRNVLGARWIVPLCDNGVAKISVAVAAAAADLTTDGGLIQFPRTFGNEFFAVGIPSTWESALAVGPETAVILASRQLGKPVGRPTLVLMDFGWSPQSAQWRIPTLDASNSPGTDVYVGLRLDGTPAVGDRAIAVQRPRLDAAVDPSAVHHPDYRSARPRSGYEVGFAARMTSVTKEN